MNSTGFRTRQELGRSIAFAGGRLGLLLFCLSGLLSSCKPKEPEAAPVAAVAAVATVAPPPASPAYVLPARDASSLVTDLTASRDSEGLIVVSGTVTLPPGTKLWIERRTPRGKVLGQSVLYVGEGGSFMSAPFGDEGKLPKQGKQHVAVVSQFTTFWQTPEILAIVGVDGANLPSAALRPKDPEFPTAGGVLDEERALVFPGLSEDAVAIAKVKAAKLYVQGQGQAGDSVANIVAVFAKAPGFTPIAWSAAKDADKWIVTLDCEDGEGKRKAQWEYDLATGKVRYLDPLAKLLSWIPAD